mgnify:CR=1 FL=1
MNLPSHPEYLSTLQILAPRLLRLIDVDKLTILNLPYLTPIFKVR